MPTLSWIGKEAVENHHNQVPFRLLKRNNKLSVGEVDSGNLLVQGDNLEALKALLPYYAGQVKCIYIDPPYNTGNENWVYNDNVNSTEMKDWLGKVVGKEIDDLSRHDKWLCMMYPRLKLLKQFLKKDGVIFVSIDDNEINNLKFILDEVFGRENFMAQLVWKKKYTGGKHARHYVDMHEYILVFARDKAQVKEILMPRPETEKSKFTRKDKHFKERGKYYIRPLKSNLAERPTLVYPIRTPDGKFIKTQWIVGKEKFSELLQNDRVEFTKKRDGNYQVCKKYYEMDGEGKVKVPSLIERFPNTEGKFELKRIFGIEEGRDNVFYTVKPLNLIKYLLNPYLNSNDLVLDSFAGTGTTGHAILDINKKDSGNRRFILVEMEKDICERITYKRLKSTVEGFSHNQNGKKTNINGLGGGFSYCQLGQTLFNAEGQIREEVSYNELARHIYFCETGEPLPKTTRDKSLLLGTHKGVGIYLLYNGILKDKKIDGGNVLTGKVLAKLPKHEGKKVIYGTACRFSDKRLRSENIVFKQTPYEIRTS